MWLAVDLAQLDLDERVGDRRRVLYVYGGGVRRFLNSGGKMQRLLRTRKPDLADEFAERYGDRLPTIGEYWRLLTEQGQIELVDLAELETLAPTT